MEIASLTFYMIGDNEISSHKWTTTCSEHYFQESVWHKRMKVSLSNTGLKKEALVSRLTFFNSDLKLLTDCQVKTTWKCSGETEVVQSDVIFLCRKVGHTAPCFSWKCDKMSVPGRRSRDIDAFHMWHEGKYRRVEQLSQLKTNFILKSAEVSSSLVFDNLVIFSQLKLNFN